MERRARSLLVLGQQLAESSPGLNDALRQCHIEHRRPRCLCVATRPEMYVARLGTTFVAKRMPGTREAHANWCLSSHFAKEAVVPTSPTTPAIAIDPASGHTVLKLSFTLDDRVRASASSVRNVKPTCSFKPDERRLTLHDLLLLLWQRAELDRWQPSFAGKRNWSVVHARVTAAAQDLWIGNYPLLSRLHVPEAFRGTGWKRIEHLNSEWLERVRCMPTSSFLLLAELKSLHPNPEYMATFKHLSGHSIKVGSEVGGSLQERLRGQLEPLLDRLPEVRLIGLFLVTCGDEERPVIKDFAMETMNTNWLPVGYSGGS